MFYRLVEVGAVVEGFEEPRDEDYDEDYEKHDCKN